jgi:hypothetical protein
MKRTKPTVRYMHTINAYSAFFDGDQIVHAGHGPIKLATNLRQIKREQRASRNFRDQRGWCISAYNHRRVIMSTLTLLCTLALLTGCSSQPTPPATQMWLESVPALGHSLILSTNAVNCPGHYVHDPACSWCKNHSIKQ